MGIADSMSKNMKKNMQEQMKFQKQLIIKQRQTQLAIQMAIGKQRFKYFAAFYVLITPLSIIGAIKKKDFKLLGPIIPLTFILAFQYDLSYGSMLYRVRQQADRLIVDQPFRFYFPDHAGIVSTQEYQHILGIKHKQ